MARHRLDDEIVRLPVALHDADRVLVRDRKLVRHALDEAHVEPAAREHVDGRKLLGAAQRIGPVADRIAEHEEPRMLRLARQHRERHDRGARHAGRGRVVLVHHDVQAELVREPPFVVVPMQQVGSDPRVLLGIGKIDPQRAVMLRPRREVRLLGELVDAHAGTPVGKTDGGNHLTPAGDEPSFHVSPQPSYPLMQTSSPRRATPRTEPFVLTDKIERQAVLRPSLSLR